MRFYLPLEPDNVPPKQQPQPQRLPQESACPSPLLNSFHSLLPMFLRTIKLNGWATAGRNGRWLIRFARRIAACVGIGSIRCSQAYNHGIRIGNGHVVFHIDGNLFTAKCTFRFNNGICKHRWNAKGINRTHGISWQHSSQCNTVWSRNS